MYAIETYYVPPTNYRGSRIAARVMERGISFSTVTMPRRLVLNWDAALNPDKNHKAAAQALATKLSWAGHWTSGGGDHGAYVWVRTTIGAGGDDFHVRAEDCLA